MNNELKELLRSVLKEELKPINERFDGLEQRFDGLEQRFDGLEQRFDGLEQRFNGLENRFDGLEKDIKDIKAGHEQLQKNIITSLGEYTEKIVEYVDNKTGALNNRVFAIETEIQRINRQ